MIGKNAFTILALASGMAFAWAAAARAAEPAEEPEMAVPYTKLDEEGKNLVKMSAALKLKEIGWGDDVKGGKFKNYSLESLLAAARMLRELPKISEIDPKEVETIAAKEPAKEETKPPAPPFSPAIESKVILQRIKDIVDTFEDAKEKAAYGALITSIEKIDNTKAIIGGPRMVNLVIQPGQTQNFRFAAVPHAPSVIVVRGSGSLRYKMVRGDNGVVHYHQSVVLGEYSWVPRGSGAVPFQVTIHNSHFVPVSYMISVR